ncbi:MAG: tetratricopeptide repeat protein [Silvanigrellales bacterium]|nr:tetratricopeptide repeat protein [Silvanigrellales bacterium]
MAKFDKALWNELQGLTTQEKEIIKRFETNPTGPAFVSVSELLRKRGYLEESIVTLEEGLRKFPQYHSARAALAKDYFQKGLMQEAQREVDVVLSKSPDNLMAQRLRLRIALLFEEKGVALEKLNILRQLSPDDEFTRLTREALAFDDWNRARSRLVSDLERQGIRGFWNVSPSVDAPAVSSPLSHSTLPEAEEPSSPWKLPSGADPLPLSSGEVIALRADGNNPFSTLDETLLPEAFNAGDTLANVRGDSDRYLLLRGFRMVNGPGAAGENFGTSAGGADRGEEGPHASPMESTTLAGIYESQGLPLKALEIYEKLLLKAPDDESLLKKRNAAQSAARAQLGGRVGAVRLAAEGVTKEEKIRKLERLLTRLEALP